MVNSKFKNLTLFFLALFVLPSCLKQKGETIPQIIISPPPQAIELDEAESLALSDLPVPLGFHLITYETNFPTSYYCYQGKLSPEKIEDFLQIDSERNGWEFDNLATAQIKTYLIKKLDKTAIINVERKNSVMYLHINLRNNKSFNHEHKSI
ncbi:hypothetical protein FJ364_05245 [Candidatus Dependentiae bacterium]|nr:hypothetical protein [Candidatus Dependentiae bacterium]